jgi:hypothetical protein
MRFWIMLLAAVLATALVAGSVAIAEEKATVKPAGGGTLEVRAETAFNNGQWALALPMLKQVADKVKDNPDRLATIQEQIRVCESSIAKANLGKPQIAAAGPATVPAATQPSAEARKPIPAPKAGQVTELLIKDLGNFDYDIEKGGNIPADVKALSNTKFRTRGYMIPLDQADSITEFALVPSLFACCFGQPPQIQHTLVVHCPKGKAVSYFPDEISVEGNLRVEEKKDDGYIISVFEIDASSVKPAPK